MPAKKKISPNLKPFVKGDPRTIAAAKKRGPNKSTLIQQALAAELMESLDKDAHPILNQAIRMAKKGDRQMIKFILDKILPSATIEREETTKGLTSITINVSSLGEEKGETFNAEVVEEDKDV